MMCTSGATKSPKIMEATLLEVARVASAGTPGEVDGALLLTSMREQYY